MRRAAPLAALVFLAAAALSAKTASDLIDARAMFPSWVVPAFVVGLVGLVSYAAVVTLEIWRARAVARPGVNPWVLILLPLSFICTSAVHQFYPFRPSVVRVYGGLDPTLQLNLTLTGAGFVAALSLALLYRSGLRERAILGWLILDLLLLVPNDACANPFNTWWIDTVGASPLMFVPNLFASLFGIAALLGIRPRWNTAALAAACVGVTLLGLGHMTRVIW